MNKNIRTQIKTFVHRSFSSKFNNDEEIKCEKQTERI